ncbi:MAG: class I SAM-dependent rRNA methyltransferase [Fusobacterium necrophorum]|nr:class I SAM-dependent rRNA methyltransferase [Fusobacterium necrophorum]KDE74351.1 methyltransferase [Fusobacterium necrophorum BFTR-2]MCI7344027.1 class I SAM-dependent rRNA methyltransferase [Fusobacterium necrophorum]MCI7681559.1 class I SAM-dependent rRNA methyltransferase [Fusobacterium necrophorum]MDY2573891.1 class I SAM-dependent rRNA methyltransferase [Fusobacterium necrophorum]MDY6172436.1 class I SAM-dependent rRNA methyltransferase [Fusobacterium necrophorum]
MAKIVLQRGKEKKIQNFYPNVFQDEIREKIGAMKTGDLADIVTEEMEFIARGYVTEGSSAYVRILSTKEEKIDKNFFQRRIRNAYERRKNLLQETNCVRVFFSEGDGIPGLIIDKFEHYVAVQFRNSGLEAFRQEILNAIKKYLKPKGIYERSDVENRTHEGVEQKTGILFGEIPERIVMEDNGVKYHIDIVNGQKTGFFLDQRDSRKFIQRYIDERTRFLDVFSSSGGFSMAALRDGAKEVIAIDKDAHALALCRENYVLNGFHSPFSTMEGDAFLLLETLGNRKERFNIITLDPPSLIKRKAEIYRGRDFFLDLCEKSIPLLEENGILGVMTCAYHISLQDLIEVTRMAASKHGKKLRVLGVNYQPEDHPWILHIPETLYLKALWVQIVED